MELRVITWLLIGSGVFQRVSVDCWVFRVFLRRSAWFAVMMLMMSSDTSGYGVARTSIPTAGWIAKKKKTNRNSCSVAPHSSLMCSIPRRLPWVKVSEMTFLLQVMNSFTATPLGRATVASLKSHVHSDVSRPHNPFDVLKIDVFFPCAFQTKES